jgi:short-subunit dehydrogenase
MKVVIIGATSAIAFEVAKHFARAEAELFLVARSQQKLDALVDDLRVRGAKEVHTFLLDLNELARHEEIFTHAREAMGEIDLLLIAHGTLPDQQRCQQDVQLALQEFQNNSVSIISLATIAANSFEAARHGCIAVISSVAGDRGRQSNYLYGAAKAAVSTFLEGLRGRLASANVKVITIKPGMVDTPMTAGFKKGLLFSSVEKVGGDIYKALEQGKEVVYVPGYWALIMLIIRSIPGFIFKRVKF